jgi:hypothetical protein
VKDAVYRVTGTVLVTAAAWEANALLTGRYPTVTSLCRRYPVVEAAIIGMIIVHVHILREIIDESVMGVTDKLPPVAQALADLVDSDLAQPPQHPPRIVFRVHHRRDA